MRSLVLLAFLLPAIVLAQGNQGGMMGGGFSGGESTRLFLSPGDRTEWTFDAKPGELIFLDINSDVFDPAVAIIDEKGTKLAENDDVAPGQQRAAIRFPVPSTGKFRAVVTNYKGTAGGPFDLRFQKYNGVPLPIGRPTAVGDGKVPWILIDKPGLYSVVGSSQAMISAPAGPVESTFLDPTSTRVVFLVAPGMTGIYCLPASSTGEWTVAPVETSVIKVGEPIPLELPPGTVRRFTLVTTVPFVDVAWDAGEDLLMSNPMGDVKRPFLSKEEGRMLLHPYGPREGMFFAMAADPTTRISTTVRPTPAGRPWTTPKVTGELSWYGYDLWTFDVAPGELVTVRGDSPAYRIQLDSLSDLRRFPSRREGGGAKRVLGPESFPGPSAVLVTGGGRGRYTLTKDSVLPTVLPIGRASGSGTRVYRVVGKKGADYALAFQRGTGTLSSGGTPGIPLEGATHRGVLRIRFDEAGERIVTVTSEAEWEIALIDLNGGK